MRPVNAICCAIILTLIYGCNVSTPNTIYKCNCNDNAMVVSDSEKTEIRIVSGKICGYIENGIFTYKGIPYAKAERFMPPTNPDCWEGTRSCRSYGPVCPQSPRTGWKNDEQAFVFNWDDGYPDENCQVLNVWTPDISDSKKRPVMVWIHGGGFSTGSSQELPSYDGANLTRQGDVVVVSLNHRLNVLGHLDLSAYGSKYAESGNVGLLDIVAALRWIQDNIHNFGGDASNVTIFGQSGGGRKVSTLLAMPSAKGLFHKAIIQSGPMTKVLENKWSRRIGVAVVENLKINPVDIDIIQNIPYQELASAGEKAIASIMEEARLEGYATPITGWTPVLDGDILPLHPFYGAAPEQSKDIPLIIGTTRHEFTMSTYLSQLRNKDFDALRPLLEKIYGSRTDEYIILLNKAYPDCKPLDYIDTDFRYRPESVALANLKSRQKGAPVYMYMFSWESPVVDGIFRSTHCLDIPFVFNNTRLHSSFTGGGAGAERLADKMSKAWTNFAYTGNPNTESLPHWPEYTCQKGATMFFDNECMVAYNHDEELICFINSI